MKHNARIRHVSTIAAQRGLTLVELMIAMLLGLLLTAGMIQVFMGNRVTYAFNENLSRIQENSRFALQHMAEVVRMGGYTGCIANVGVTNNLGATSDFRDDLALGIQGFEYDGTGPGESIDGEADPMPVADETAWVPELPTELDGEVIAGSDVLVVRNVSPDSVPLVAPFNDANVVSVEPTAAFLAGEILVVTDCLQASIFQVSDVDTSSATRTNLAHANAASLTPGNAAPGSWSTNQSYGLGSEVARLEANAFYVGRGESGAPALFRLRLQRIGADESRFEPEELVEGIDTMQVRYGLDTDNDRQVDAWQSADVVDAANNWDAVVSVEISLLARATEEYGVETDTTTYEVGGMQFTPAEDRRFRQVFTTIVGLRNRLP